LYDIEIADFQIAGGLILLLVAIHTINQRHWDEGYSGKGVGIVPIACPLLVGPGAVTTSIIYMNRYGPGVIILAIAGAFALTFLVFRFTNALFRLLGETGAGVVARLMGMLLAAIAVQFIRQGVVHFFHVG
jgi:multiple antibiotic resistance protein